MDGNNNMNQMGDQMYTPQQQGYTQQQGMPIGNMNVNLNGSLEQKVDTRFLSKVALVLAILSIICCCIDWLFSIPAVICAIIVLVKNKKDACA